MHQIFFATSSRALFLFVFLLTLSISLTGQYKVPPKDYYKKAKIVLNDSEEFKCSDLNIVGDSINFFVESSKYSFHLEQLKYIEVRQGHSTFLGILGGFVAYGVTFIVSDLATENDIADSGDAIKAGLVGGLIGGFIGAAIPPKKKYYPNGVQKE